MRVKLWNYNTTFQSGFCGAGVLPRVLDSIFSDSIFSDSIFSDSIFSDSIFSYDASVHRVCGYVSQAVV